MDKATPGFGLSFGKSHTFGLDIWRPLFKHKRFLPSGWAGDEVTIVLWVPMLILGMVAMWMWFKGVRRRDGFCAKCGYDLTGLTTSACPECGQTQVTART